MKNEILLELAAKWERDAKPPEVQDASPHATINNAMSSGMRNATKGCASDLRDLIKLLGEGK